jgi:hypothetical protein
VDSLNEALSFCKDQASFHERKAREHVASPRRLAQHEGISRQFLALAGFLERQAQFVDKLEDELSGRSTPPGPIQLALRLEDIDGLPDELIRELSITDGDKMDFMIQALMNEHAGVMSLDQLLIALYRKTGEVHKRPNINSRMYRMTQKGAVFNVPGRKGAYSTRELSSEESAALGRGQEIE